MRSNQDVLEIQKCCSEMAQAGRSSQNEVLHVHMSSGGKDANDCLEDFSLSQNASSLRDSQLESTSLLVKVYNMLDFEPLHNLHKRKSKLLKECTFKFHGPYRAMTKPKKSYKAEATIRSNESVYFTLCKLHGCGN